MEIYANHPSFLFSRKEEEIKCKNVHYCMIPLNVHVLKAFRLPSIKPPLISLPLLLTDV